MHDAYVDSSIDIAPSARDDHSLVVARSELSSLHRPGIQEKRQRKFVFDKSRLKDFYACNRFEEFMWQFDSNDWADVNQLNEALVEHKLPSVPQRRNRSSCG